MNNPNDLSDPTLDERLADFTDRARGRVVNHVESHAQGELRRLEETILRLNRAFPANRLEEGAIRRMQASLHARRLRAAQPAKRRWRSSQSQQRLAFALTALIVLVGVLVLSPWFFSSSTSGTASAISPTGAALAASALAAGILLLLWIRRRK